MKYITKVLLFGFALAGMGFVSTMELVEQQQVQELPKDKDGDGIHDGNCECGYCLEITDTLTVKL